MPADGRGTALLLGISLLVVMALFVQSFHTLRSHRAIVDTTLQDFAAFGAERIASELDQWYSTVIPEQLELARALHYRPDGAAWSPREGVGAAFSMVDSGVVVLGGDVDAATRSWIRTEVLGHLPGYPPPAPYVVLRRDDARAIVYRKEEAYGRQSVYGFVLRFDAEGAPYSRIVAQTALVPRSLVDEASSRELFEVGIHLAPDQPPLYQRVLPATPEGPEAWAFAPKAGRLAVRVRLDAEAAARFMAGGRPPASLALLSILGLVSATLLYAALTLVRRGHRLAVLRESFVANVSHDLRTPLTQIRMFSETLRRGHLGDPGERERALAIIERQTEVMEDLVDNLLHASGQHGHLRPEPTDLDTVVSDVIDGMAPLASARGSHVERAPVEDRQRAAGESPGGREALIDPTAATRILTNLVDNAIRHGREGGRVVVDVRNGDGVTFTVDDDGPGIPADQRDVVFGRFEQRSATGVTGTGLGLSVVRTLAERHGGHTRIEASPLGGTRVIVHLEEQPVVKVDG